MKVRNIITNRPLATEAFWQIVYEWEDIVAKELHLRVRSNLINLFRKRYFGGFWRKILRKSDAQVPIPSGQSIAFVMRPGYWDQNISGKKMVIPVIIDFWLSSDKEFMEFERNYQGNPAVLITSREAYEIVRKRCPKLRVFHWPLSLPDSDICSEIDSAPKKWDCAVVGRPNSVLNKWMMEYASTHKDFSYVYNRRTPDIACNYVTSNGDILGNVFADRQKYRDFLKSARVGLYSTPRKDDSRKEFKGLASYGYNQVTPRFLEYIAAGCHVLSRYDKNPDTDYYELDSISPHIETYTEFERRMDYARTHVVDRMKYKDYLIKHTTSARVEKLREILGQI